MSNADGERIAPVTYLFRGQPEEAAVQDEAVPPSAPAQPRQPLFVDLGERSSSESGLGTPAEHALAVRAEIEREAREHVARDSAFDSRSSADTRATADMRKAKGSFDPINNVSMHALARRGMSSREMRDFLVGREFSSDDADQEVERLESVGLLDDVLLAETLVRTLRDRKGFGRSALTGELRRRHVDPLAVEVALESLDDDELERATEIAHKRASQLSSYDAATAKRRLHAFLQRKGYSGSVISTAVQRALAPSGPTFR